MFHQFNNITGRLIGSSHVQPYYPIGVQPLNKYDSPKIVFQDSTVKPVKVASPRHSSSSASGLYSAIRKKQELFQKKDGLPVHIKGGPMDRALFGLTFALCGIGMIFSVHTLYVLSYPKKP
ncbi:cytochrome c oxidase subunit 7A1, mitochondrial-like [Periplaneta americana]|uniref:cytochrome c oxidase subunit 7A1, mitochondrial-like n=1 Tax=Periplaneta americana TaxID=6978 RepID=UPI0037E9C384